MDVTVNMTAEDLAGLGHYRRGLPWHCEKPRRDHRIREVKKNESYLLAAG